MSSGNWLSRLTKRIFQSAKSRENVPHPEKNRLLTLARVMSDSKMPAYEKAPAVDELRDLALNDRKLTDSVVTNFIYTYYGAETPPAKVKTHIIYALANIRLKFPKAFNAEILPVLWTSLNGNDDIQTKQGAVHGLRFTGTETWEEIDECMGSLQCALDYYKSGDQRADIEILIKKIETVLKSFDEDENKPDVQP